MILATNSWPGKFQMLVFITLENQTLMASQKPNAAQPRKFFHRQTTTSFRLKKTTKDAIR
jgi:hypothetical protein